MAIKVMMGCDGVWFGATCPQFRRNLPPICCSMVMRAVDISETFVYIYKYLRRRIPEDRNIN
jgi:hypothetical protein